MNEGKPPITVFACGGTISMTARGEGGAVPTLSGRDLVEALPALGELARLDLVEVSKAPSGHLGFPDVVALARLVSEALAGGAQGIVVVQGTDTIEETVFALDLLVATERPLVVTGAMRNPSLPGADGPANLLDSVTLAASEAACGLGALVSFAGEVHAARHVTKIHSSGVAAFDSGPYGGLGRIVEGRFHLFSRPPPLAQPPLAPSDLAGARVALATIGLGEDGAWLKGLPDQGYRGLVVEGLGGGHVPPAVADAIEALVEAMPVVLASRIPFGEVLRQTYGYLGGEIDLRRRGVLSAGWLGGLKARVLLTLALASGEDRPAIAERFAAFG